MNKRIPADEFIWKIEQIAGIKRFIGAEGNETGVEQIQVSEI
ncbi:hypothetical protein [Paenibacillus sp. FSL H8-0034]